MVVPSPLHPRPEPVEGGKPAGDHGPRPGHQLPKDVQARELAGKEASPTTTIA